MLLLFKKDSKDFFTYTAQHKDVINDNPELKNEF